jgi:secondary thiamine-phosphate synthase enzyme
LQTKVLDIASGNESSIVDLTDEVVEFCRGKGDGLVNVFAPHATAGVALIELGSGTDADLWATLERLLPRRSEWAHRHGSPGHGADHVLPAFISPSLTLPVLSDVPKLGTWQSVVLVDPNRDNRNRQVRLSFVPG